LEILSQASLGAPILAAGVAIAAAYGGTFVTGRVRATRLLVPLSGCILVAVAVFGLIPELIGQIGWMKALLLVAGGYGALTLLDRLALPVCPSCDQKGLHALAAPLIGATALHAFVDGWGLVAVQFATPRAGNAVMAAILLHKIPEGLALGTILRAAFGGAGTALAWCAVAELATVAGGFVGQWLTAADWVSYPLAFAAGTFLFLGVHALWGADHHYQHQT
jgi:zinc transporter ZupT